MEYNNTYGVSDDLILHGNNLPFRKSQTNSFIYFLLTFFILKQAPFVQNKSSLEFNFAGCLDYKNESLSQVTKWKGTGGVFHLENKLWNSSHQAFIHFYISCILRVVIATIIF